MDQNTAGSPKQQHLFNGFHSWVRHQNSGNTEDQFSKPAASVLDQPSCHFTCSFWVCTSPPTPLVFGLFAFSDRAENKSDLHRRMDKRLLCTSKERRIKMQMTNSVNQRMMANHFLKALLNGAFGVPLWSVSCFLLGKGINTLQCHKRRYETRSQWYLELSIWRFTAVKSCDSLPEEAGVLLIVWYSASWSV